MADLPVVTPKHEKSEVRQQNCYISDVLVLGDIIIRNGLDVVIRNTRVFGSIQIVDSSNVGLFGNEVVNGDVLVIRPITAFIAENRLIKAGPMGMVIQEVGVNNIDPDTGERLGEALIFDNTVQRGVIQCIDVGGLAFARSNIALAIIGCPGQLID